MNLTRLVFVSLCLGAAGAASAAGGFPSWIAELVGVRAAQTAVVRDPLYSDQFLLCWQGRNGQRYAGRFAAQSLQDRLQTLSPGQRTTLSSVISGAKTGPTARDAEVCFSQ